MRRFLLPLLALLAVLLPSGQSQAQSEFVLVLTDADGAIVPAMESYIQRGLDYAEDNNAELVVIQLNTPGGSVAIMQDIISDIRNADVPVVVYVSPKGGMAASAGTLITLAGHVSAMAPETVIGAASPINGDGSDLNETADSKAREVLTASVRTLTENRSPEAQRLAEATINDAEAVSAREALEVGLIDFIAEDVDELLSQIDGRAVSIEGREVTLSTSGLTQRPFEMSLSEQILLVLTDPTLVFTLLGLGVLLIIMELRVPGGWVAGTIGLCCFVLAIYGLGVLPVNWLGLGLFGLAFFLFILEIQTPQTNGVLSVAAAISIAGGGIILLDNPQVAQYGELSLVVVVVQTTMVAVVGALFIRWALKAQQRRPTTAQEGLIGLKASVRTPLDPVGMVFVHGEYWKAESLTGRIETGQEVEVVEVENLLLRVRGAKNTLPVETSEGIA